MQRTMGNVLALAVCFFLLSAPFVFAQDFCQGDFTYDGDVDADDVTEFLDHFGRSQYFNPCPPDGPAPVPETGQTTCYDQSGVERDCITIVFPNIFSTGEDGAWEKGVTWPNPRFTDNGDGTVTDNLTGLIWLKDANCFLGGTWQQSLDDCNGFSAGFCGLTDGSSAGDWRLPNIRELLSLIDFSQSSPALPTGHPFTNLQDRYWSSTTSSSDTGNAMFLNIDDPFFSEEDKFNFLHLVAWPVRGGQ